MILEVATSLFLVCLIWWIITTYEERKDMPPGPLPLPIIGNMLQLRFGMFASLEKLSQKYGDIFTLTLPNESAVFITSGEIAREALVTNRDDVGGRIVDAVFDRVFEGKDITMEPLGRKHSFRRKVFKSAMHVYGSLGLGESGERANTAADKLIQAIDDLNGQPFSPEPMVKNCMIASLWEWLTSNECSIDHPTVLAIEQFFELLIEIAGICILRNFYPILKYLPSNLNKYQRKAEELRDNIFGRELDAHLGTYRSDVNRDLMDSFIRAYEEGLSNGSEKDCGSVEDVKGLMLSFMTGGADTSATFIVWFILFMVVYPEIQEKLHEELDKVVGKDRKPQYKDTGNLHLLQATLQEVFRCSNGVPFINRNVHRDTVISGYKLRKRTRVVVNMMSLNNDPRSHRAPELFRPERYLDNDGKFEGAKRFPDLIQFGAGVRRCPGENLGRLQDIMFACSLLHGFKWRLPEGETPPTLDAGEFAVILSPKPYKVVAIKRF